MKQNRAPKSKHFSFMPSDVTGVSIKIPPDLDKKLEAFCIANYQPKSVVLRAALIRFLEEAKGMQRRKDKELEGNVQK